MSSMEAYTGGDLENNIALKIIVQEPEGPTCTPPAPQDPLGFFETLYPLDWKNNIFPEKSLDVLCILQTSNLLTRNSPKSYLINIKKK